MDNDEKSRPSAKMPMGIWALGLTSLFMDISSEMTMSLYPVLLVSMLSGSAAVLGLIEGCAHALSSLLRIVAGTIADSFRNHKVLAILSYGLAAIAKPLFPLAQSATMLVTARLIDRVGKGIRSAPRDALIAEFAPEGRLGAAFGLRRSLDALGGFIGPFLGIGLLVLFHNDIRKVMWIAVIPAFISVAILWIAAYRSPALDSKAAKARRRVQNPFRNISALPAGFWKLIGVLTLVQFSRYGEAFLILRLYELGLSLQWTPIVVGMLFAIQFAAAYSVGRASDKFGHRSMLLVGFFFLIVANIFFALSGNWAMGLLGVGFFGVHLAFSQGVLPALIAKAAPDDLRGTAFGVFHLASAASLFVASVLVGYLWTAFSAALAFGAAAILALMAIVALTALAPVKLSQSNAD